MLSVAVRFNSYFTAFCEDHVVFPEVHLTANTANILKGVVSIGCIGLIKCSNGLTQKFMELTAFAMFSDPINC